MSAAMADLGYTAQTEIDCPHQYSIPGTDVVVNDWIVARRASPAQGLLTLHNALVQILQHRLLPARLRAGREGRRSSCRTWPRPSASARRPASPTCRRSGGIVPDPQWKLDTVGDFWATGDAINLAIGQGYLLATPLQMANAYAAIANGGTLLQPFIVEFAQDPRRHRDRDRRSATASATSSRSRGRRGRRDPERPCATRRATPAASARPASSATSRWPIAGKTGTAQTESGARTSETPLWFAAFGPYGEAQATIASIVMVESKGEGVSFAAPATRAIYEAY